jgi:hypothetical protein
VSPETLGKHSTSHIRRSDKYTDSINCVLKSDAACEVCGAPLKRGASKYCGLDCYRIVQRSRPADERFWGRVNKTEACWLWTGHLNVSNGYGQVSWSERYGRSKPVYAHRMAWELTHGPIPAGQSVLHHCDVPACVNPAHLFLGSQRTNMEDAARKGRLHVGRPNKRKITTEQLLEVDALIAKGVVYADIARAYGVTRAWVSRYARGSLRRFDRQQKGVA